MIYQVRANLLFSEEDEAKDFYHDCELALAKSRVINPDSENIELSTIELINNNHDQEPNQPCELIATASNQPEH
ncbi:hypothetical protein ES705_38099 [subsurface metagenome]